MTRSGAGASAWSCAANGSPAKGRRCSSAAGPSAWSRAALFRRRSTRSSRWPTSSQVARRLGRRCKSTFAARRSRAQLCRCRSTDGRGSEFSCQREDRMVPKDLRYAKTHEWARIEGDVCTVGITQFAVEQLTDVVAVELPKVGKPVVASDEKGFGVIESVKAVSDLYAPVNGDVLEVNKNVANDPAQVAADPYGKGWLIKIKMAPGATANHLLTAEQYEQQIASQGH